MCLHRSPDPIFPADTMGWSDPFVSELRLLGQDVSLHCLSSNELRPHVFWKKAELPALHGPIEWKTLLHQNAAGGACGLPSIGNGRDDVRGQVI